RMFSRVCPGQGEIERVAVNHRSMDLLQEARSQRAGFFFFREDSMPAFTIGNPGLLEGRPGLGVSSDFTPAAAASASVRPGKAWAVACLEEGSSPGDDVLASFLINALYLIGDQRIFAYGGLPAGVEGALVRLGHRVESDCRSRKRASRPDRAVALGRTLGRGGESEILENL